MAGVIHGATHEAVFDLFQADAGGQNLRYPVASGCDVAAMDDGAEIVETIIVGALDPEVWT